MKVLKNYNEIITYPYSNQHQAIDIVGNNNNTHVLDYITAIEDGKIIEIRKDSRGFEDNGSYGNYVLIDHLNGYKTRYAHMNSVDKNINDYVKKGDILGYMGATGYAFGGHLHFEVIKDGIKIDPTNYVFGNLYIKEEIKNDIKEEIKPKLIFTCPKEGYYYIKLNEGNKIYYLE